MSNDATDDAYRRIAREERIFMRIVAALLALPIIDAVAFLSLGYAYRDVGLAAVWPWWVPIPAIAALISFAVIFILCIIWQWRNGARARERQQRRRLWLTKSGR